MRRIAVALAAALVVPACAHPPCITPPPMATSEQDQVAASVAAQLQQLPVGGNLSASYSQIVQTTYDKLADNDKSLYLFLLAIDCYLKDGKVGREIAQQMAQIVQARWAARETSAKDLGTLDRRSPDIAPKVHAILSRIVLK